MLAEERAFSTIDLWMNKMRPDISQNARDLLISMVEKAILDARRGVIEECAAVADTWPTDENSEAPYWPHEIAMAIRNLKEVNNEKNNA